MVELAADEPRNVPQEGTYGSEWRGSGCSRLRFPDPLALRITLFTKEVILSDEYV